MTSQKWGTLALYLVMVVVAVLNAGTTAANIITWIFIGLAVVHLIEFIAMLSVMRKAGGSMANHFVQTLFFGFMHWRPLQRQQQ